MTENNALVGVDYRALADELAAALEGLYNEQNGPPLLGPNHEPYYAAAIAKTDAALAKYRAAKGEGNE